jgi:hypothetical protein
VSDTFRLRPPRGQTIAAVTSAGKPVPLRAEGGVAVVQLTAGKSYELSFR